MNGFMWKNLEILPTKLVRISMDQAPCMGVCVCVCRTQSVSFLTCVGEQLPS